MAKLFLAKTSQRDAAEEDARKKVSKYSFIAAQNYLLNHLLLVEQWVPSVMTPRIHTIQIHLVWVWITSVTLPKPINIPNHRNPSTN